MILIGARAAYYTPIDTSTLINSQFRKSTLAACSSPGGSATQPTMPHMFMRRQAN
jgi:hypothetical protein